jgi:hypothetical protein
LKRLDGLTAPLESGALAAEPYRLAYPRGAVDALRAVAD